jgi:hypothetical protein
MEEAGSSPRIIPPHMRPNSFELRRAEIAQIRHDLCEKHREELKRANWIKRQVLYLRLGIKARWILGQRV